MIKFEEHEGKLFRMLDKPVPLTADSNMPCLVRLIQDDSPMGRYNQSYSEYRYGVRLGCCMLPIIATHIAKNGVVNDIEWDVSRYEIIGYPVAEGSKEWALHQMMQGEKVCHKKSPSIMYCKRDSKIMREVRCGCVDFMSIDAWLNGADNTGWQIYEEPKPETLFDTWQCPVCGESISAEFEDSGHPRYNEEHLDENLCFAIGDHMKYSHTVEQPKYKVGDWVEMDYKGTLYHRQVISVHDNGIRVEFGGATPLISFDGKSSMLLIRLVRKLKPNEVYWVKTNEAMLATAEGDKPCES